MGKIKVRVGVDSGEQSRFAIWRNLVPTHVRKFYGGWQGADLSWQKIQAAQLRRLCARFKEHLEAETNSKEGNAPLDGADERFAHLLFIESANQRGIVPHSGQEQRFRFCNLFRRIGAFRLRAN